MTPAKKKPAKKTRRLKNGQMLTAGIIAVVVFGALGGMMPTLLRIAASLANDANAALTELAGAAVGTAIYGFVGATVAFVRGKKTNYDAFITGIAAPAIVASMINGATDPKQSQRTGNVQTAEVHVSYGTPVWQFISSAQAQIVAPTPGHELGPSVTIIPKVIGSMPTEVEIRMDAQMSAGNKVPLAKLRNVDKTTSINLPPNTKGIWIGGQYVDLKGPSTTIDLSATTRPSFGSGVLFALGGPRPKGFEISTVEVKAR